MRAAAQLISYEVSQALSLVGVIITAGTLSLTGIVHAQRGMWFFIPQFVGFLIFMIASFAETGRSPFDLVEAETELVGGYFTEYGGTGFVAFLFAEYMNMMVVSGIAVTMFFGGWLLPFGIHPPGWVDPIVVIVKILLFFTSRTPGCEAQKTASRSPTKAPSWRPSASSRSRRRWQTSPRRTSPGTTGGGQHSVFARPWSTTA